MLCTSQDIFLTLWLYWQCCILKEGFLSVRKRQQALQNIYLVWVDRNFPSFKSCYVEPFWHEMASPWSFLLVCGTGFLHKHEEQKETENCASSFPQDFVLWHSESKSCQLTCFSFVHWLQLAQIHIGHIVPAVFNQPHLSNRTLNKREEMKTWEFPCFHGWFLVCMLHN